MRTKNEHEAIMGKVTISRAHDPLVANADKLHPFY
jgi:hypothetical protein